MSLSNEPASPAGAASEIRVWDRKPALQNFLRSTIQLQGSDLHLQADCVPMVRVDGRVCFLNCPPLTDELMVEYAGVLLAEDADRRAALEHRGAIDLSYALPDKSGRFRVNIFHSRQKLAMAFRRIITRIPTFQELSLPPQVEALADAQRGLIVVSGTTGAGKSTTLAALLGKINRTHAQRIITVEDPIEYHHENLQSFISQVEVGTDSESYEFALREMLRQDPDTILLGEIRDSFSLSTALRAADTGHLVFTTVHAATAAMTVERLVSLFDPAQRELQQQQLGMNLVAVCCQRLGKRREGKGRVPAVEILLSTPLVRKYIFDGTFDKLKGTVGNREAGCQSFDQHLAELFHQQIIDAPEARRLASNVDALNLAMRGITNNDTRLG